MTMTDEELVRVYRQAWDEAIARIRASETPGTTPTPAQRGDHVGAAAPNLTEDGDEDPFNDPAQEGDGSW
jgi:hypothetical protein